jgi:flagellar hook-length control protein FliK
VKSAEETLNRLLASPASDAGTVPAEANAAAAARDGASVTAKDGAALSLTAAGETAPVVAAGEASSRRGGEEQGGEGRSPEGQARATAAEQQSARLASVAATDFQTSAAAVGTGIADAASPGAQIARRIAAELANPASRPAALSSGTDGAVRVLQLQLEPANLGSVTVKLALKDDVISVHLEASRHETALAIEKDRELLSHALKSAGYVVDNISSQPGDMRASSQFQPQPVANDGQMGSSLQSHSNAQQDLAQSGRGNQGDGGRQGPDRGSMPAGINESRGEGSRASGGALYV